MKEATEAREAQGAADDRQRELTSKVGATLAPRSKQSNSTKGTWRGRLGMRSKTEA